MTHKKSTSHMKVEEKRNEKKRSEKEIQLNWIWKLRYKTKGLAVVLFCVETLTHPYEAYKAIISNSRKCRQKKHWQNPNCPHLPIQICWSCCHYSITHCHNLKIEKTFSKITIEEIKKSIKRAKISIKSIELWSEIHIAIIKFNKLKLSHYEIKRTQ